MYISFGIFQTRIFNNLIFAYSLFRKALEYDCNIIEKFYIFVGHQMLQEQIKKSNQLLLRNGKRDYMDSDYEKFLHFEQKWSIFNLKIAQFSKSQIQFLGSLINENKGIKFIDSLDSVDLDFADKLGKGIENLNLEINNNFKELHSLLSKHFEMTILYGIYKKFLRNEEDEGNMIISK